jgi:adenylate kinase
MAEPYGTIIPIQPVFRSAGFQGIIVLTSHPAEILRRRKEDPNKRRQDRFLEERVEEVERQQTLMVAYFVALGVHLGVNTVLVPNTGDLESAVESCEQAIELFHKEEEFRKTWSQRGGK